MNYTYDINENENSKSLHVYFEHIAFHLYTITPYFSSTLCITKDKDYKGEVNVANYFMDFLLLLFKLDNTAFSPQKIWQIDFINTTIRNEELKIILYLCELATDVHHRNKSYYFKNCVFPKGTTLGTLSCKNNEIVIENSQLESILSLNKINSKKLTIRNTSFKNTTGNVTLYCKDLELDHSNINIPLFCIQTQAPYLDTLKIYTQKTSLDKDLLFLHVFKRVKYLEMNAIIKDTTNLDKMRNLKRSLRVLIEQEKDGRKYYMDYSALLHDKWKNSRVSSLLTPLSDEEYNYWNNKIEYADIKTIKKDLKSTLKKEKSIKEVLNSNYKKGFPDIKSMLESGQIRLTSTRRIDLDPIEGDFIEIEGIPYYETDGIIINGKSHKSSLDSSEEILRKQGLRLSLKCLLSMHSIIPILEYKDGRITSTIIDAAGNFSINGSLTSDNVNDVQKQIKNAIINSSSWERKSNATPLKRILK